MQPRRLSPRLKAGPAAPQCGVSYNPTPKAAKMTAQASAAARVPQVSLSSVVSLMLQPYVPARGNTKH